MNRLHHLFVRHLQLCLRFALAMLGCLVGLAIAEAGLTTLGETICVASMLVAFWFFFQFFAEIFRGAASALVDIGTFCRSVAAGLRGVTPPPSRAEPTAPDASTSNAPRGGQDDAPGRSAPRDEDP